MIAVPLALLLVGYMLIKGNNEATVERTRKEPTGTVHNARPGAGTANERVGQG